MITPPSLKKGDKVGLISTARKISKKELIFAINTLKSWELEPVLGKNLFAIHHQFAGTTQQRAADLQAAINQPEIKAIICVRGGYGTVKLIDFIQWDAFIKNPKWIAGYSDVTILHAHINKICDVKTLHSTMPINFETNSTEALLSLKNALFGINNNYKILSHKLNRVGIAKGEVVGGNLSILYSLLGSTSDIDTKGKILFIEDLDEYLYHIDRMMTALKRLNKFTDLAGLIVGRMTNMHDNDTPFGATAEEIILDAVKDFKFPVCFNFPVGHQQDNRTLILGSKIRLKVNTSSVVVEGIPS